MFLTVFAALGAGIGLFFWYGSLGGESHDLAAERDAVTASLPEARVLPDLTGSFLCILCDANAAAEIGADQTASTVLSAQAVKRNTHLMLETGAQVAVTQTDDFVGAARRDLLSGDRVYNLYAASVSDGLCRLLSDGCLADVSTIPYVDRESPLFDFGVTDSLSLFGKTYFLCPSALDVRKGAYAVAYNRALEKNSSLQEGERTLASLALDGHFTLETMLSVSRAVSAANAIPANALGELAADEVFYGICASDDLLLPVYLSLGGSFAESTADGAAVTSLAALKSALKAAGSFFADENRTASPFAFEESAAFFTVCRLSDLPALTEKISDVGILPMPKIAEGADYRCPVDLAGTEFLAIPKGTEETETLGYLLSRMAFLSEGYVSPYRDRELANGDADNLLTLSLIRNSTVSDLSSLFGYGDIPKLLADTLKDDSRLAIEYYNRKTLYEKALTVIEHRLAADGIHGD